MKVAGNLRFIWATEGSLHQLRREKGCLYFENEAYSRWTPHPVIVTIRDNRDYIKVLPCSYYTTVTGWGVLLKPIASFSFAPFER